MWKEISFHLAKHHHTQTLSTQRKLEIVEFKELMLQVERWGPERESEVSKARQQSQDQVPRLSHQGLFPFTGWKQHVDILNTGTEALVMSICRQMWPRRKCMR